MQDFSRFCILVAFLFTGFSGANPISPSNKISRGTGGKQFCANYPVDIAGTVFHRSLNPSTSPPPPPQPTINTRASPKRFIWCLPGTTVTLIVNVYQEIPQLKDELLSVIYDAGAALQHSIREFGIANEPVPYDDESMIRLRQVGSLILQAKAVSKEIPMTFEVLSEALVILHDFTENKFAGSLAFEVWDVATKVGKGRLLTQQVPPLGDLNIGSP